MDALKHFRAVERFTLKSLERVTAAEDRVSTLATQTLHLMETLRHSVMSYDEATALLDAIDSGAVPWSETQRTGLR